MTARLHVVLDARATTAHFPGVGRATLGLLEGLRLIDHRHQITVLGHAGSPSSVLPIFGDPRFRYLSTPAAPLGLAQQWRLPYLAHALRPDVWHAPYYVRPFWGIRRPVVSVYDIIGHLFPEALPSLRARLLFELTLRLSLRSAHRVIASSYRTKQDLIAAYGVPSGMIAVVPLGVDARFVPQSQQQVEAMRARYRLPPNYILYLGSNKPHKNIPMLVQAFARLDTDAALVVAGRWDARYGQAKDLRRTLQLEQRVHFLHDLADEDVPRLLSGALLFVFPSRYEGFGLPPLEAMACGTPVVAADTGALPEVVGDAGLLVRPEADALTRAMQQVLDDPGLRQTLCEHGLARAKRFSWLRTAEATLAVYRAVELSGCLPA